MRAELQDTLEGYIKHAEHYGTEEVFESALDNGLDLRQLGWLALRLQNLDPKWKLTQESQHLFVLALVTSGWDVGDAARAAGCTKLAARNWVENHLEPMDVGPELALRRASKRRFEDLQGLVRGWRNRR